MDNETSPEIKSKITAREVTINLPEMARSVGKKIIEQLPDEPFLANNLEIIIENIKINLDILAKGKSRQDLFQDEPFARKQYKCLLTVVRANTAANTGLDHEIDSDTFYKLLTKNQEPENVFQKMLIMFVEEMDKELKKFLD